MRNFGTVSSQFWTGDTGKRLRSLGPAVQVLGLYLVTSPHAHMCGLYYVPLQYIAYETGLSISLIKKSFDALQSEGFAFYDEGTETVWVKEMAHWQVGAIKPTDNKVQSIRKWYRDLHNNPFIGLFYHRYAQELQLEVKREGALKGLSSGSEGAAGGLQAPIYPYPDPIPVPVLEGGVGETKKPHGEFGRALLTDSEHSKLKAKLDGLTDDYVARFDRWVHDAPNAKAAGVKRKDRQAYPSILAWYDRDVKDGKVQARTSPDDASYRDEVEKAKLRIFGKKAP